MPTPGECPPAPSSAPLLRQLEPSLTHGAADAFSGKVWDDNTEVLAPRWEPLPMPPLLDEASLLCYS